MMRPIRAPDCLNEASEYGSAFARGMRVDLPCARILFLSGTASIGTGGETLHPGDFEGQVERTFRNLDGLLGSEGAAWTDVIRTTVYLRDMAYYDRFNRVRNRYYADRGIAASPPASTCVEAHLCREDLLVEIEGIAIVRSDGTAVCPGIEKA